MNDSDRDEMKLPIKCPITKTQCHIPRCQNKGCWQQRFKDLPLIEPTEPTPTKVGDIVKLNSGGPPMTVESVEKRKAVCVWHDLNGCCFKETFLHECLTKTQYKNP
jgi:uncharacterized protein YodC (DUF2158 family)